MSFHNERGQMLLVVVLTMIVALTVGLSVASRTVTNLRISRQNEESQKAFLIPLGNNTSYTTTINNPSGTDFLLNLGEEVDQDTGVDLWLSNPDYTSPYNGDITLYWSDKSIQEDCNQGSGDTTISAIEVVILSGTTDSPVVSKYLSDWCSRITGASVPGVGGTLTGTGIEFNYTLSISGIVDGLVARIIPIYNSSIIGVNSTIGLPDQGTVIESVGESGDTVRKVQYFSSHPQIPLEIFPYSIISQ
jgi:hypothetical protein